MVRSKSENGILIIKMAAERWNMQVATVIGEDTRMTTGKDMEYSRVLMETDTWGNSRMISYTAMEYTDGLMDQYIMENKNLIKEMVKDISNGQTAMNIAENSIMTCYGEREYS